jgi:CTP synthase
MIDDKRKEKVAYYCNMDKKHVISNPDCETIYELPLIFDAQEFDTLVLNELGLPLKRGNLQPWRELVEKIKTPQKKTITIGIIAKYIATGDYELKDSYYSLIESLNFASWHNEVDINLDFINAEQLEKKTPEVQARLEAADGIIVPIGWGERGVEGKIAAVKYARENKVPYLGLCYGMQLASVEFARTVCGLNGAHTTEVNPTTPHPIIHSIPFDARYQTIKGEGASMRLGAYDCILKPGTLAHRIYTKHNAFKDVKKNLISERHRHRFEFNNDYRKQLADKGFVISGTSPDDFFVEMIELPESVHPFFFATQAHPEYKSRPLKPHPIFVEFLQAVEKFRG